MIEENCRVYVMRVAPSVTGYTLVWLKPADKLQGNSTVFNIPYNWKTELPVAGQTGYAQLQVVEKGEKYIDHNGQQKTYTTSNRWMLNFIPE